MEEEITLSDGTELIVKRAVGHYTVQEKPDEFDRLMDELSEYKQNDRVSIVDSSGFGTTEHTAAVRMSMPINVNGELFSENVSVEYVRAVVGDKTYIGGASYEVEPPEKDGLSEHDTIFFVSLDN